MTQGDDTTRDQAAFDDDRLLAFALGLEDDPDLESAAAVDAALRDRLEAMRADIGAIASGLERVVPPPPDDYAELSGERWGELKRTIEAPAPAAPRRRRTWLRVLAPAAAIALVLVAGVVGVQRLGESGDATLTVGSGDKGAESYDERDGATQDAAPGVAGAGSAARSLGRSAPDPAAYATILIARAAPPGDVRQRFEVLRVLRDVNAASWGIGDIVRLTIVDRAVAPLQLVVLFLDPAGTSSPSAETDGVPTPAPAGREVEGTVVEYEFNGTTALAQELPGRTDPDEVTLP